MPKLVCRECVAAYGACSWGRADEYLKHSRLADLVCRQRITRNRFVVGDVERLDLRCEHAEGCGNSDACHNHDLDAQWVSAR